MTSTPLRRAALVGTSVLVLTGTCTLPAPAASAPVPAPEALPLGAPGLAETRTTTTLQPGVTLTRVVRGAPDPALHWVVEVAVPSAPTSPDPAAAPRAVQDEAAARAHAATLAAAGLPAEVQPVQQPELADVPGGTIGYRVRLTERFATQQAADDAVARLAAAGSAGRSWYTGWDGGTAAGGPWTVDVVTVDPARFDGEVRATYGPDLERREPTTGLAALADASVAVNGGFFVFDPQAGAEGDPAGVGVYDGSLESEPVGARPALVVDEGTGEADVDRPRWRGELVSAELLLTLDGTNRVPGLVRNCGGTVDDAPTWQPRHDVTCTDDAELVAFTPAFGATTPAGEGTEVVLDDDVVVEVRAGRGVALAEGQTSVQGTGVYGEALATLDAGERVDVRAALVDRDGMRLDVADRTVVNGGPELVRDGREHVTLARDGMVHPGNPSFQYGWALQRNPRTFAGVDADGRLLLVVADGRQVDHLGLSVPETAAVARALGMVEAVNLDGGGSTTLAVDGQLASSPSDTAGERPVGDAVVVTAGG
ncbi:phosphodiester glycosidase family protein [Geodermatophilus sp. DSM 44513]|uniref:phosphodiester glycosidase family protein n=1 Tax=Geodermatophilus sp. DSM 44513 TaxID=1528104 RepID=UPI00126C1ADD|nr:phosphodiester glycosidase family protein [Geodermatophilus sp. DSM 44513]WNV73741.1 phosphodiester glycosidase family protein [Geodermatophilus sp. DSM 44513]